MRYLIEVYGIPGPQGSKRHVGNGVMLESSKKVKPWRELVHSAALSARMSGAEMIEPPLDCPLMVRMVFTLPKPQSAPKRRRRPRCLTPRLCSRRSSTFSTSPR